MQGVWPVPTQTKATTSVLFGPALLLDGIPAREVILDSGWLRVLEDAFYTGLEFRVTVDAGDWWVIPFREDGEIVGVGVVR